MHITPNVVLATVKRALLLYSQVCMAAPSSRLRGLNDTAQPHKCQLQRKTGPHDKCTKLMDIAEERTSFRMDVRSKPQHFYRLIARNAS